MALIDTIMKRRSVRKYTGEAIPEEKLELVLRAGLLAPTSRNLRPCEFYLVRNRETLQKLSEVKKAGGLMLADADAAVVVFGDSDKADTWIEDCSIALSYMNLMAAEQGVGSCWVQIRLRAGQTGGEAEQSVRDIFGLPANFRIVGILSLGIPADEPVPHTPEDADLQKVHPVL